MASDPLVKKNLQTNRALFRLDYLLKGEPE